MNRAAIIAAVAANFRTFGGGKSNPDNPLSVMLAERPLVFAGGVNVADVVYFIFAEIAAATSVDHRNDTVDAMVQAESFIAGFEGDELQEGIPEMLSGLREAIIRERISMGYETAAMVLLREAVDDWSRFDKPTALPLPGCIPEDGEEIEDGDVVEWFGKWRERAKTVVERADDRVAASPDANADCSGTAADLKIVMQDYQHEGDKSFDAPLWNVAVMAGRYATTIKAFAPDGSRREVWIEIADGYLVAHCYDAGHEEPLNIRIGAGSIITDDDRKREAIRHD